MKIKKIFYLFLFFMIFTLGATSFATEGMTEHTIEIIVPAAEEVVMPYMWDDGSFWPITGTSTTPRFTVDSTNFAFETNATDVNGNACSANYTTSLMTGLGNNAIASVANIADGATEKVDWINVNNGASYYFKLTNHSNTAIAVYLKYYSW